AGVSHRGLLALPPADLPAPPQRSLGRRLAIVVAVASLIGIAVFSFGMRYQSHSAPGLVDLVDRSPAATETAGGPLRSMIRPPAPASDPSPTSPEAARPPALVNAPN